MRHTSTSLTALILTVLFTGSSTLISCQSANSGNTDMQNDSISDTPDESSPYLDDLGSYDFGGETFTVLCREIINNESVNEVAIDEESGDIVDDAIYKRDKMIGERFNVNIEAYKTAGNWPDREQFNSTLKNSVMANDGAYDLVLGYQAYSCNLDVTEYLYDFNSMPIINLDADYYYHDIMNEITINGKLYYLAGDFTYSIWPNLYVYFFNKQIADDNHLSDLYDLVRSGDWTIDKVLELSQNIYQDLNGNTKKDKEDLFGVATDYENVADAYYSAFQIAVTTRDNINEAPVLNTSLEKIESISTKMRQFYKNTESVYSYTTNSSMTTNPLRDIFVNSRALFLPECLKEAITFRSLETDFGILPYPKWDKEQDNYYTQPRNNYSVMMVPRDVKNIEKTAVIIEALNAESCNSVIPAFYDKALKVKFTRDEDSADMLDIIRDGISFNFGYFYQVTLNDGATAWRIRDIFRYDDGIASTFASCQAKMEANLQKIVDFYYQ
ncbi:MAG: hypothetical protein HFE63_06350 [Clostridiales bacterium]|nr:hypothetical protein [Clostridiales bacterium]